MRLKWRLENIENYREICYIKDDDDKVMMNPATTTLLFATSMVGLNKITEKNLSKWYIRLKVLSKLHGKPMAKIVDEKRVGVDITLQDLINHIGLSTNSDVYTDAQFWMHVRKGIQSDYQFQYKNEVIELNESVSK